MKNNFHYIYHRIIIALLFAALVFLIISLHIPKLNNTECIPPVTSFEYPIIRTIYQIDIESIPPKTAKWIASLPDNIERVTALVYSNDSLWFSQSHIPENVETSNLIIRYDLLNNKFFEYTSFDGVSFSKLVFYAPLVSASDSLFSVSFSDIGGGPIHVMEYDPQRDRFSQVPLDGLEALREQMQKIADQNGYWGLNGITGDSDGNLWLTDIYNLYLIDTKNKQLSLVFSAEEYMTLSTPVVGRDHQIWMLDHDSDRIIMFDASIGDVKIFPENYRDEFTTDNLYDAYFDSQGRLWIADTGWLDTLSKDRNGDPIWHQIVRSSVFITEVNKSHDLYYWNRPDLITETEDDIFWFSAPFSLVRLDAGTGEWCKISSGAGYSSVVEDQNGMVWILHNAELYQYVE